MKRKHEAKAHDDFRIGDPLAKRMAHVLGGVSAGLVIGEVIRDLGEFARAFAPSPLPPVKPRKKTASYHPPLYIAEVGRSDIVNFIAELFKTAGWRVERGERSENWGGSFPLLLFDLPNLYQSNIARQAVEEFFHNAGFVAVEAGENGKRRYSRDTITLLVGHAVLPR
jgi:hypothetical protein